MPASSSGRSPPPRAMKRELAFALRELASSPASPGRTRSGRLLSSSAPASSVKRRRRSELVNDKANDTQKKEPTDPVSPSTPPMEAEAPKPKQPLHDADLMDVASFAAVEADAEPGSGVGCIDGSDKGGDGPLVVKQGDARVDACDGSIDGIIIEAVAMQVCDGTGRAVSDEYKHINTGDRSNCRIGKEDVPMKSCDELSVSMKVFDGIGTEDVPMEASDGLNRRIVKEDVAMEACAGLDEGTGLQESGVATGKQDDKQMDACDGSNVRGNVQDQVLGSVLKGEPLVSRDGATDDVTAEPKSMRRFTRSLLKSKIEDDSRGSGRQCMVVAMTPGEEGKDTSADLTLPPEKPARRFTRSLLKVNLDMSSSGVGSEDAADSMSDSSASVKKMEMKMSKKVACLTKPPGNIRELLGTGLLDGMQVVYVIPNSKRAVLKGVITGCNIRCFCQTCNGSKAISANYFEQHAGSNKKHPSDYIYLGNGKSLREVLRACESSSLDSLEKTICSSIDSMVKKKSSTCLNCNECLPSSETESFLCHHCVEPKQPQDPPSQSHACESNSSLTPSSKDSSLKKISSNKKSGSAGRLTTKDNGLHKLVFKVLLDGTEVAYYVDGKRKIDGYIKDQRIYCNHCNKVVSPSAFEAHAGEGTRRKPYDNIFTSNGVSLHELSMKISMNMSLSERETDDLCGECGNGGEIFPCKICPRSFHPACVGLSEVPSEWYCDNCCSHIQKEKALAENKNAKAAGRQAGVDSIEQIMKRAIRIVPISDDLGGCALCKQKDFNNAVFDERTVILCDQCEKEFHIGCLRSQWQVDLKELPEGEWFCCRGCSEMRSSLDEIISRGSELLQEKDIDVIRKKSEMRGLTMGANVDVRWRLLAGRSAGEDGNLLLSAAVPIIHESFDPIVEVQSGRDLIPEMVNGRRPKDGMPGQDYSGMYCAVLTIGSTVVSAALLRVMGSEVAELPLVATSRDLQGLGYFQVLFSCIERMLVSLRIKHFVLPAAQEAESIWTNKFGFSRIPQDQLEACLNGAHLTVFHGTSNLYKAVPLS